MATTTKTTTCGCCGGDMPARDVWEARRDEAGECDGGVDSRGRCRAWSDDALWAAEKKAMTFGDFWNACPAGVETVWFVSVAYPAGEEWTNDFGEGSDPEADTCDLAELAADGEFDAVWDLEGTVTDGVWQWDGEGDVWFPVAGRSSLLNLKVFAVQ